MASKAAPPKQQYVDLALQHISRQGGVVAVDSMVRLYSQDMVDYLIKQKKVSTTTLVVNDKENRVPARRISAIFTHEWKRERPAWLDKYIGK